MVVPEQRIGCHPYEMSETQTGQGPSRLSHVIWRRDSMLLLDVGSKLDARSIVKYAIL